MNKQPRPSDRHRIPITTALIAAVIVVGTSACGGPDPIQAKPTTPPAVSAPATTAQPGPSSSSPAATAPTTTAPAPTTAAPAPASSAPASTSASSQPVVARTRQATVAAFVTPSGRIACAQDGGRVRCDYLGGDDRAWQRPAPNGCMLGGWGSSFDLRETVGFGCVGDTIIPHAASTSDWTGWFEPGRDSTLQRSGDPEVYAVLGYGQSLQTGAMVCSSESVGVTCTNTVTGAGFFVSRESYEFFGPRTPSAPVTDVTNPVPAGLRQLTEGGFVSPSGNIGCAMGVGGVRCDYGMGATTPNWQLPARPADCQLDWGDSLTLDTSVRLTCHGDTVFPAAATGSQSWFDPGRDATVNSDHGARAVLGYGETLQAGDFFCSSDQAGVTCYNSADGNGFFISRDSYRIF